MKRCPKCKNELNEDARFCNICGTLQPVAKEAAQPPSIPSRVPKAEPTLKIQPINKRIPSTPKPQNPSFLPNTPTLPTPGIIRPIVTSSTIRHPVPPATSQDGKDALGPLLSFRQPMPQMPRMPKLPDFPNAAFPPPEASQRMPPAQLPDTPAPESLPTRRLPNANHHAPAPESLPTRRLPDANHRITQNDAEQNVSIFSPESVAYTSKAAERWRESWRDRQYAEAGPAENASRGQAAVPRPLLSMQNSLVRMRAIIVKQKEDKRKVSFGFWVTILLMICLIGGLAAYVIYSYLPNSAFNAAHLTQPATGRSPTLSIKGTTSTIFKIGQSLQVEGANFGAHDTIRFLLDTSIPITSDGAPLIVQANGQGTFVVTFKIASDWPTGDRTIQAVDTSTNASSYLIVQIIPDVQPVTSSPNLSVTLNKQAISVLSFTKQVGQPDPRAQRITITNTSGAVLDWSASVMTDNNVGWLVIEDNNDMGQLAVAQPQSIGIGVDTSGLAVTQAGQKPYAGQILITINNDEVLTLRVQLTITDATPELVFSPTPIFATAKPDGTCQAGATLTLINLGDVVVSWTVNPDLSSIIQFVDSTGKVSFSGTLNPSGSGGDTLVLTLRCNGVHANGQYHVSIYIDGMQASDTIIIQ